jgi:hypothetical protein
MPSGLEKVVVPVDSSHLSPKSPTPPVWHATIHSPEAGVEIFVDGKSKGMTPQVQVTELVFGRTYKGVARKEGFATEDFIIENKGHEPTVSIALQLKPVPAKVESPRPVEKHDAKVEPQLQPRPIAKADPPTPLSKSSAKGKLLKVASSPTGADIIVDGKQTGRKTPVLPAQPLELSTGKHRLQFKLNGKLSPVVEVVVAEGDNTSVIRAEIPP